jgi:hypothetical protein
LIVSLETDQMENSRELQELHYLCIISLVSKDGSDSTAAFESSMPFKDEQTGGFTPVESYACSVIGETIIPGKILQDPQDGEFKIMFPFYAISCRVTGEYRFRCIVVDIDT